ncbi:GNAT family N-acetyltransferase [Azohydromonas sp.]|uniref:GNAT family N-acetyltransferase n=1 Tax=Azohydromonas sp. TaxID=1872666 RepID=UPI002CDDDE68|nr:GNAT family N-acetyltransferase [Azohydromonas sp.]HMM83867.1 GNAT family N-acetyltransferase [Azohydromonas sp.]
MPEAAPRFDDDPDGDAVAAVDHGLDEANRRAAPQLADVRALACVARDADGAVIGGAVGRTWGECAELQQLWVDARHRGRGLGTALLRRFEARAAGRGCTLVYCSTFSFQAPAFYRRLGYEETHRIAGFACGIEKFHCQRRLPPAGG